MDRLSRKINTLFAKEQWQEARSLIHAELEKTPEDHWLLERLATTYYEERRYAEAQKVIQRAQELAPNCPLVLWTVANTLDMLGKPVEAADIYSSIIRRVVKHGFEVFAADECDEGIKWMVSLLADCVFRLGICCEKLKKKDLALKLFLKLAEWQALGIRGIHSVEEVQKRIKRLVGSKDAFLKSALSEVSRELTAALR